MTAPESWLLVGAVAERLRAIKIADGYRTDAGLDVITEHAEINDRPEAPQILVFLDGELQRSESSSRKWRDFSAPIAAQCRFPLSHARAQRQAHDLMADLNQAIPPDAPQLTTDEWNLEQNSLAILQRPNGADIVVVQLALLVKHRVLVVTA